MSKAVVLLSGGQDSTTSLFWAKTLFDEVSAISIAYGQRHAAELESAREIAKCAAVSHRMFGMPVLGELSDSALIAGNSTPLSGNGGRADAEVFVGLPTSFVPCRNVFLLATAAAVAVKEGAKDIVTGVCQTDYSGYPDCRRGFVDALEVALSVGLPTSCGPIRIHTPLMWMTKAETVRLATRLGSQCMTALGFSLTCYNGKRPGCGACPACDLRAKGFAEAGEIDPALLSSPL